MSELTQADQDTIRAEMKWVRRNLLGMTGFTIKTPAPGEVGFAFADTGYQGDVAIAIVGPDHDELLGVSNSLHSWVRAKGGTLRSKTGRAVATGFLIEARTTSDARASPRPPSTRISLAAVQGPGAGPLDSPHSIIELQELQLSDVPAGPLLPSGKWFRAVGLRETVGDGLVIFVPFPD